MLKRQPKTFKSARTLGIFLCHASEDKPVVRNLYKQLKGEGLNPWLDEEDLEGGEDWELEIPKAVRATDVVIVCLSQGSITKTGYVQKEIKEVLDVADLQPEGAIFVIPLKLEPCEVPTRLRKWQYIDLFDERGYERLLRALRKRAESISIAVTTRSMSASATLITNQNSSLSVAPTPSVALPRDVPRQTSSQQKPGWRNWGDNPVVVVISVIAAIVSIIVFVTNSFFPLPSNTQTVATNTAGNKNVSSATPTTSTLATSFSLNIQLPTAIIQSTTTSNISSAPPQPTSTRLNTPTASVTIMPTTAPTATATPPGVSISSDNLNLEAVQKLDWNYVRSIQFIAHGVSNRSIKPDFYNPLVVSVNIVTVQYGFRTQSSNF